MANKASPKSVGLGLAALALAITQPAAACIFKYGDAADSMNPHTTGTHWNYATLGVGWNGTDGTGAQWACGGTRQSPLNLPPIISINDNVPAGLETTWSYPALVSNGSDVQVINTGHTIQVQWTSKFDSKVSIATQGKNVIDVLGMKSSKGVKRFNAEPLQFHFHSNSEHTINGAYYPLELHIVHKIPDGLLPNCPPIGCITVTGIMLKLTDDEDNKELAPLFDAMPFREGAKVNLPAGTAIDLQKLIGNNPTYVTYQGSLTTPPCSEGLLWHVLNTPVGISEAQLMKYKAATADKDCTGAHNKLAAATAANRKLLAEDKEDMDDSEGETCVMAAFSDSYRLPQPRNGRVIRRHIGTLPKSS